MTDPAGPIWSGGFETIVVSEAGVDYTLQYLPDKHNEELQSEGEPAVYYWLPNNVRLATDQDGTLRFSMLQFGGVQTGAGTIGLPPGTVREASGGVLAFTITSAPPPGVLKAAHQQILDVWKDKGNKYWRRDGKAPVPAFGDPVYLRPVPIRSNNVSVTNASMNDDGSLTAGAGIDPFYWKMQGQGPGAVSPLSENAFTAVLGQISAAIVAKSLEASQSAITVREDLMLAVWAPITRLKITANWERVYNHFAAKAEAQYFWAAADLRAAFTALRASSDIKVDLEVDKTIPGAENREEMVKQFIDLLVTQWMEQAKQVIFTPLPPSADPQPKKGLFGSGFGVGVALEFRHERVEIANSFEFEVNQMYLQPHAIGGTLAGVYEDIKKSPANEKKYFGTLYLDDVANKLTAACHPGVVWQDLQKGVVGDPVKLVAVQVGYPAEDGRLVYQSHEFLRPTVPVAIPDPGAVPPSSVAAPVAASYILYGDGSSAETAFIRKSIKKAGDVQNPPQGWTPDKFFVKRKAVVVSTGESSKNIQYTIELDDDEIELDPLPNGTLTNDLSITIPADLAGVIRIGPIDIAGVTLGPGETVDVEFRLDGYTAAGKAIPSVRFVFEHANQEEDRYWVICTGDAATRPEYEYQVTVTKDGTLDNPGESWRGAWVPNSGSGPVTVRIPRKGSPGVVVLPGE